ncbi:MAG TPA: DUF2231 domain-containing protein [Dehalococcoidia bacterium]|nr:DUF2231 domain-containing protein [Dehalococcoidia bacterium]
MRSRAAINGHPIHPSLIPIPIGLLSWALLSIVVYAFNDSELWYDMAYWTAIGGVVTALAAALPGLVDYFAIARHSDAAGIATAHMLLNLGVVVLYAIGIALQAGDNARDGGRLAAVVAFYALGGGMLALSGYLGGEMSYRHHLAVVPDDGEVERAEHRRHDVRPASSPARR